MPDQTNSSIPWRTQGGLQYDPNMPEWLRRQFRQVGGEDGTGTRMELEGLPMDEQGNQVMFADDRGDIYANGERALQEGRSARFIPGLGWVANAADTDSTGKFESRRRRSQMIAALMVGGGAAAGLAGVGAAGAAGAGAAEGGLAATIPADIALSGGAAGSSIPLAEIPAITGAGGASTAGGLSGLGAASSGGGLAASVPADLALSTGGAGASTALAEMPAIAQAGGGGSLLSQGYNALGGASGIARTGLGLASLGAAASGGGGQGGETNPQSIIEQMAAANRVDHNTPIGSRRWSQDPATGRWTVNDAMSPEEQANFEGVQGLNASSTQVARDRLAALLAKPVRRYDRPLGT
jgi:hypothetical protein